MVSRVPKAFLFSSRTVVFIVLLRDEGSKEILEVLQQGVGDVCGRERVKDDQLCASSPFPHWLHLSQGLLSVL